MKLMITEVTMKDAHLYEGEDEDDADED